MPKLAPGDIVLMDNLAMHKCGIIRKLIRAVGARLDFLPPFSPDLNPIEQVFSKLKTLVQKARAPAIVETITMSLKDAHRRLQIWPDPFQTG